MEYTVFENINNFLVSEGFKDGDEFKIYKLSEEIDKEDYLKSDKSVEEYADDERIEDRNGGRFGRRGDTAVNAAQNDDRAEEREEALAEYGAEAARVKAVHLRIDALAVLAVDAAVDVDIDHENAADEEPRDDAGDEEVADGASRGHTVHDEGNARRNDDAEAAGDCDD